MNHWKKEKGPTFSDTNFVVLDSVINKSYGIIKRNIQEGSAAWNAARRFDEDCDSESLMKHFDVAYKSNTISAMLRFAEEYVEILCSNKRVQSSDTEEQTAVLMESVVDALELSFAKEIDEDAKLNEASALLMKAMQVTAMLKRAPSDEQKI